MFYNGSASVDPEFFKVFEEKFNIIDTFVLKHYDADFDSLKEYLKSIKKEVFDPKDRIVVVQFDCDYYLEGVCLNLYNLLTVWKEVDIPLSVLLFYTCHIGVRAEIDRLCRYSDPNDRPTVVETFFNIGNYDPTKYPERIEINENEITHHCLALMGNNRSHRFALYNHVRHLLDKIVLTIKGQQ